jgi:hypothetical protein
VLSILTWRELDTDLLLVSTVGGEEQARGEATDAAPGGLSARLLTLGDVGEVELVARLRSSPRPRDLPLELYRVRWDGKDFNVELTKARLPRRATRVVL